MTLNLILAYQLGSKHKYMISSHVDTKGTNCMDKTVSCHDSHPES